MFYLSVLYYKEGACLTKVSLRPPREGLVVGITGVMDLVDPKWFHDIKSYY